MDSQPRWLDIQNELYLDVSMLKHILFQNTEDEQITQYYTQVRYNSFKREIDLTQVIYNYFLSNCHKFTIKPSENCQYQVLVHNKQDSSYMLVGVFPIDSCYILGQQFLSIQILHFVVRLEEKIKEIKQPDISNLSLQQQDQPKQMQEKQQVAEEDIHDDVISSDEQKVEQSKLKLKSKRTIQQILKLIAQWRKLIILKNFNPQQAADQVKMSKRSLQEYYNTVRLAEKYGFSFQEKMNYGFGELRNFVKEHHQSKKNQKVCILQKFKQQKK